MEIVAIILITATVTSALNMACFLSGAKIRQKVDKGESIEIPAKDPLQVWRELEEKKEAKIEQEKLETIMENIDNYDGTSEGQKDVPM